MTEMIKKYFNITEKKHTNPCGFHEIDEEVRDRLDFEDALDKGISFTAIREHKNNRMAIQLNPNPLFYKGSLASTVVDNHQVEASFASDQVLDLSYTARISDTLSTNLFFSSPIKDFQKANGVGTITFDNKRTNIEVKGTNQNEGLIGLSVCHGVSPRLAIGFESYFKQTQKSGGGSIGARYFGTLSNNHKYLVASTYNLMGDFNLSMALGIIPGLISIATRLNLNTNSMDSKLEFGTQITKTLELSGHEFPITLKKKIDTKSNYAGLVEVGSNIGSIAVGVSGVLGNKNPSFGVHFSI
eukprot:gene7670-9437_t